MFKKLVAIEPVSLIPTAEEALHQYAEQVELYRRKYFTTPEFNRLRAVCPEAAQEAATRGSQ